VKIRTLAIKFEPRDIWVGVYWLTDGWGVIRVLTLYICLLPCLPLRIDLEYRA
jgi:hypothetical protein